MRARLFFLFSAAWIAVLFIPVMTVGAQPLFLLTREQWRSEEVFLGYPENCSTQYVKLQYRWDIPSRTLFLNGELQDQQLSKDTLGQFGLLVYLYDEQGGRAEFSIGADQSNDETFPEYTVCSQREFSFRSKTLFLNAAIRFSSKMQRTGSCRLFVGAVSSSGNEFFFIQQKVLAWAEEDEHTATKPQASSSSSEKGTKRGKNTTSPVKKSGKISSGFQPPSNRSPHTQWVSEEKQKSRPGRAGAVSHAADGSGLSSETSQEEAILLGKSQEDGPVRRIGYAAAILFFACGAGILAVLFWKGKRAKHQTSSHTEKEKDKEFFMD